MRTDTGARPFDRVLIANRGEIALRIQRTCRDLGIETVAVYSDADADAAHVRTADVSIRLGPTPAAESYLRADAIVEAAVASGAQAIHPGYGFLSERASFARSVDAAGLVFIGPAADAIDALGDKLAARRTAHAVGVPVVPGMFEAAPVDRPDQLESVIAEAERIGFPLLVKAAAGGGGRGMRRVASRDELAAALAAGSSEARAAFGDGSVYLERELHGARHVEVQLLGDRQGTVVALGERDCSTQRRHQKLVEESPAPGLTDEQRARLHRHAVDAARAAHLENAATAEFLVTDDGRPWFLEVNARLQVEHGVTELVTGLDLVAEQLWIAAGAPLSSAVRDAAARALTPTRHAIEVRIAAEDPSRDFTPTPGRIGAWRMPAGPNVRVDTAISPGDRVPPDYDPLIAKLMTDGPDRDAAIATMLRALDEVIVTGIQTTVPFHRWLMRDDDFRAGRMSIELVAARWSGPSERDAVHARAAAAALAAVAQVQETPGLGALSLRKDDAGLPWRRDGRVAATEHWPR